MHEVLQAVLHVVFVSVFVDLDDGAVDDERSVVCERLQALFVVSVAILRFQVFVEAALLVLPRLLPLVHFVNVLKIGHAIIVTVSVIFEVTQHLRLVLHDGVNTVSYELLL